MVRVGWTRSTYNIAHARAGNPDFRSAAENRTVSHVFRRAGDWRAKSTGRAGTIGKDEYPCLYAWENAAAYGSDGRLRNR